VSTPKNIYGSQLMGFMRRPSILIQMSMIGLFVCLTACSKAPPAPENIPVVKAWTISADQADNVSEFPGEVVARVESKLGFRVAGKIIDRKVDVGAIVKKGQLLMQLDPQDLQLAQRQADAALKSALSSRDLAKADLDRYRELRAKNFVNQAAIEAKETAYQAALSSYEQALAASRNQSNQTAYTSLVSDMNGVVTAINAEVGQVVAAGTPVVSVADTSDKEVSIAVPENKVDLLRQAQEVRIRLWANPDAVMMGHVREVSPIADPVTRTYTIKVALPKDAANVKLGMTAYVSFVDKAQAGTVALPLSALYQHDGKTAVWVIDQGVVHLSPVTTNGAIGNKIVITQGVTLGQTIVVAGVNLLKEGQKVKILESKSTNSQVGVQ
jgi:multidrug efflux system membrane fusion protein